MPVSAPGSAGPIVTLTSGGCRAEVDLLGASLRRLRVDDRDLILAYGDDEARPHFRGAVLAPWPNRVTHGRWTWNGEPQRLDLTEAERGHAIHGLVAWQRWVPAEVRADSVTLSTTLRSPAGYPFTLDVEAEWTLDPRGARIRLSARNVGTAEAPYGCGIHPYLVAPGGPLDSWSLRIPARSRMSTDEDRVPTGVGAIPPEHDFRASRAIGAAVIDHAFTELDFPDGRTSSVVLVDRHGRGAEVEFDTRTRWVQIYTSDDVPGEGYRRGVAVEPMTCPPDALRTLTDLALIQPDESHVVSWRVAAVG
jgi:aldose 1-epimerase